MSSRTLSFGRLAAAGLIAGLALGSVAPAGAQAPAPAAAAETQVRLVRSDESGVELELEIPGYEAREQTAGGSLYASLSVPGLSSMGEAGRPQLPTAGAMIGVPPGAQTALQITIDETELASLAHPPLPEPTWQASDDPSQPLPGPAEYVYAPDPALYASTAPYPAAAAQITSDGTWRSQRFLTVTFNPLQYNPAARTLTVHRRLRVAITFTYPAGLAGAAAAPGGQVEEGPFEAVLEHSLLNYASARDWRAPAQTSAAPRAFAASGGSAGPWHKIAVDEDGIYRVTCEELNAGGVATGAADFLETLKLYTGPYGDEIAVRVVGGGACNPGEYFEFFGQKADTKYTDTNLYWLTHGGAPGRRMATRDGSGGGTTPDTFVNTVHIEQNLIYRSALPYVENADHWYWNFVSTGTSSDYPFQIDQLASGTYTASLTLNLTGLVFGNHLTKLYLNGDWVNPVGQTTWSGQSVHSATVQVPQSALLPGANTLRIEETQTAILVNWFEVGYASDFTATGDALRFRQETPGAWQFEIDDFGSDEIDIFEVTDPLSVTQILSGTVSVGPPYTLEFADTTTEPREYLVTAASKTPLGIVADTPSDLRNTANGADYLVIAHGDFISGTTSLQTLAGHRESQGLRVEIVDVQDVYDEFSRGLMDAQALRDFLEFTFDNWQAPAPAYVLLVGDGHFDFKDTMGFGEPIFVPPYLRLVDPWLGETASDNRLVAFEDGSGNNLPQMAIGRLPANSAADVDAMVDKILSNEQNPPDGDWRRTVTFVSDNAYKTDGSLDGAGNFWAFSDEVAGNPLYVGGLQADRIYYNPCDPNIHPQCSLPYPAYPTTPTVSSGIVNAINDGRLIVNYVGHSGFNEWAHERLFGLLATNELSLLTNTGKYPVILAMTCLDGFFHYPDLDFSSLAESIVRLPGKGALASWSATGQGVASGHDYLDQGFFAAAVAQGVREIGPATTLAKAHLWANSPFGRDLVDTFILLGDPASALALELDRIYLPLIVK